MEPVDKVEIPIRPKQVRTALYLIFASILLGMVRFVLYAATHWADSAAYYTNPFTLICFSFSYLIQILVAIKIGQGRNWARLLFVIGFSLEILAAGLDLNAFFAERPMFVLFGAQRLLEIGALYMLFQAPTSAWFKAQKAQTEPQSAPILAQTSDRENEPAADEDQANEELAAGQEMDIPIGKIMTVAGAVGGAMGLINPIFWTLSLSPPAPDERELIYFLMIAGFTLGAALGAALGFTFLQITRRSSKRSPARWAIAGGVLGGLFSFICGFLTAAIALIE